MAEEKTTTINTNQRIISRNTLLFFCLLVLLHTKQLSGQDATDSLFRSRAYIHQIGIESRPAYLFRITPFLKGENETGKPMKHSYATHLKYSFRFAANSYVSKIYYNVYQGIGVAHYNFSNANEIGKPISLYLFQGATLAKLSPALSLNYEWNFGLSAGWKPYNREDNPNNRIIGSKVNAYLNTNFYLKQSLSPQFDFIAGVALTHFSNGNTEYPNAGLNTVGAKIGLTYNFNNHHNKNINTVALQLSPLHIKSFPKHISTDIVLFSSLRRKGIIFNDKAIASPNNYMVAGFNVNPMYNLNYNLRLGLSLDGVYDSSANIYTEDYIIAVGGKDPGYTFYTPAVRKQLALGLSARAEYVMPFFSVNIGVGANLLHGGGDLKGLYQTLALKIEVTRNAFIHIGYNLQNFKDPNYLMLGIGYRLGNKYPCFYQ